MTTKTASTAGPGVQPRGIHAGVDAVNCEITLTAALSAGDVLLLGKVAQGSTLVGLYNKGFSAAGDDATFSYSLAGVAFGGRAAETPLWIDNANLPSKVSLSDDAIPLFSYLRATVSAVTSATTGGTYSITMLLTRDH